MVTVGLATDSAGDPFTPWQDVPVARTSNATQKVETGNHRVRSSFGTLAEFVPSIFRTSQNSAIAFSGPFNIDLFFIFGFQS